MAQRIFFDANIMIDLLNGKNELNKPTIILFNVLFQQKQILLCSPATFAITYYFAGKQVENDIILNEKIKRLFSSFIFTTDNAAIMQKVMQSSFTDLEDALQYYSALDAGAEVIITKNYFDFYKSSIPVYHLQQYINQFLV